MAPRGAGQPVMDIMRRYVWVLYRLGGWAGRLFAECGRGAKREAWARVECCGRRPPAGGELEVHEFDYTRMNEVIYEENGVTIRSFPQIHALDGSSRSAPA